MESLLLVESQVKSLLNVDYWWVRKSSSVNEKLAIKSATIIQACLRLATITTKTSIWVSTKYCLFNK